MEAAGHGRVIIERAVQLAAHPVLGADAGIGEEIAVAKLVSLSGAQRIAQGIIGSRIIGLSAGVGDAASWYPHGPRAAMIQGGDPGANFVETDRVGGPVRTSCD